MIGRDGEIRTRDPLHPMQVRYQAAPRPDTERDATHRSTSRQICYITSCFVAIFIARTRDTTRFSLVHPIARGRAILHSFGLEVGLLLADSGDARIVRGHASDGMET